MRVVVKTRGGVGSGSWRRTKPGARNEDGRAREIDAGSAGLDLGLAPGAVEVLVHF